jgi:hypothetical protein
MLTKAEATGLPKKPTKKVVTAEEQAELDAKKKARADRFGITTAEMKAEEEAAKKKARDERFGLTKGAVEEDEKAKKRKERFQAPVDPEMAEKMAKRAKRFGGEAGEAEPAIEEAAADVAPVEE